MLHRSRSFLAALACVSALLASAGSASADPGPCTSPEGKPSCSILRPLPGAPRELPPDAPECIVAVGGLGSVNDDATFDQLLARFATDPRYRTHRFGSTGEHPDLYSFDTYGSIDANARSLREFVRSLGDSCSKIHIVAHSMGGDVADRAFSLGLSASDGVSTYLPISTPHNGAMVARFVSGYIESSEVLAAGASYLAQTIHVHDPTTAAARDLAHIDPPRPLRDVVELRQRLASDEFVYLPDNWDWRFEIRDRLPDPYLGELDGFGDNVARLDLGTAAGQALRSATEFEGHGGSLKNAEIRDTTAFVIRNVVIPPDDRPLLDKVLILAMNVALVVIALCVGSYLAKPLGALVLRTKWLDAAIRVLGLKDHEWFRSFTEGLAHTATALAKGLVTRLQNIVDLLGRVEDVTDDVLRVVHVHVDPRVQMVQRLLDRAAQLLGGA